MPEALRILHAAERELQELIVAASAARRYDDVGVLARLSKGLSSLAQEVGAAADERAGGTDEGILRERVPSVARVQQPARKARPAKPSSERRARGRERRVGKYPRFCRRGHYLVKVGWSRSVNREYEHKLSLDGLQELADIIQAKPESDFPVTAESLAREVTEIASDQLLGYQVYAAVAWLRSEGLLEQDGRAGYVPVPGQELREAIQEKWNALPECE